MRLCTCSSTSTVYTHCQYVVLMLLVNRESHTTQLHTVVKDYFFVHKLHFAVEFSIEASVIGRCRSSQKPDKFSKNTVLNFDWSLIWEILKFGTKVLSRKRGLTNVYYNFVE